MWISTSIISNTQAFLILTHLPNPTNFTNFNKNTPPFATFSGGLKHPLEPDPRTFTPKKTSFNFPVELQNHCFHHPFSLKHHQTLHYNTKNILSQLFFLGGKERIELSTSNNFFVAASGSRRVQGGFGHWRFLSFSSLLDRPNLEPFGSGLQTSWRVELKDVDENPKKSP